MKSQSAISAVGIICAAMMLVGFYFDNIKLAIILAVMLYMIISVFLHGKYTYKEVYSSAFITFFITFFFSALTKIRINYGKEAVFLVFIFAWITDTGAYFSGRFLGKHKLISKVSPKKTWEGSIGGVISAVVGALLYLLILNKAFNIHNVGGASYIGMSLLAVIASVFAQIGDLAASSLKRDCGVMDFGIILPGHGGVMDRFDSVVFIAPMVYYFFVYFNKLLGL